MSDSNAPFWKQQYEEVSATETFHAAPRFGHSSEFSILFSGDADDQEDYATGLIFGGTLVLAIFLAWSILLLVLKCLGPRRVGFLSGSRIPSTEKRVKCIRIIFILSGIVFIAFTFLWVALGMAQVQSSVTTLDNSNQDMDQIFLQARNISASLRSLGKTAGRLRDELQDQLESFCPRFPTMEQEYGFDFNAKARDIGRQLDDLGEFIGSNLVEVEEVMVDARVVTADIDEVVKDIELRYWPSLVIVIPFVALATCLLVAMVLAWRDVSSPTYQTCLVPWLILPLFIVATVVAYSLCSATMFAVVANADFCSGGEEETPDVSFRIILDESGLAKDNLYYDAIRYYTTQCEEEDPWTFIRVYKVGLQALAPLVQGFNSALQRDVLVTLLSSLCGKDFAPLQGLMKDMEDTLNELEQNAQQALDLLSCERIVPIYTRTIYTGTCEYSVKGLTWTVCASLVVAFAGMLMLTFRSVLWNVERGTMTDECEYKKSKELDGHDRTEKPEDDLVVPSEDEIVVTAPDLP